ncbi:hypothetical protein DBT_0807 [Dissulfuribacter thermophilus]|uniref:Sulfotransferase domain-containing protein n=1 Tax=Dissulfuribacter thermophilus TaxID=1156395 RepID=A0A1B9F7J4_9BACT|nr:hypothetical protein [Dissulfuribacter thermophilus]OCC15882.1 hypothetical protein DBT_0807 [Dissulfuribacter thermophilus]
MVDLIHIGDYKTGTSWWQTKILPIHQEIYYLDDPSKHPDVVHLMHLLIDSRDLDFDEVYLREKFSQILSKINLTNQKVVICREALSGSFPTGDNAARIAYRLKAVFGSTKILIVIREQFSMLKSIYSQYIKMGGTLSFNDFVYDPIVSPGLIERLKYHKIIQKYIELFDNHNVMIGLFEDFRLDNIGFANKVFDFIGCNKINQECAELVKVNRSLTKIGLEIQRIINHFLRNHYNPRKSFFPLSKIITYLLPSKLKQRILKSVQNRLIYSKEVSNQILLQYAIDFAITVYISKLCEYFQFGPKLTVPTDIKRRLSDEFAGSNRILLTKYGLPVDKFGWVL